MQSFDDLFTKARWHMYMCQWNDNIIGFNLQWSLFKSKFPYHEDFYKLCPKIFTLFLEYVVHGSKNMYDYLGNQFNAMCDQGL